MRAGRERRRRRARPRRPVQPAGPDERGSGRVEQDGAADAGPGDGGGGRHIRPPLQAGQAELTEIPPLVAGGWGRRLAGAAVDLHQPVGGADDDAVAVQSAGEQRHPLLRRVRQQGGGQHLADQQQRADPMYGRTCADDGRHREKPRPPCGPQRAHGRTVRRRHGDGIMIGPGWLPKRWDRQGAVQEEDQPRTAGGPVA